ncbi:MAG: hypothetical protein CL608_08370 [Anaerolineaceae bacterium]|nr:hypothetical protein [Anaerolineaceae bacterium]
MPDGGVLQSELDQVSYAIPSGTFTNTVTVTHMAIFQDIPPTNRIPIGRAFEITAVFSDTGQTAVLQKPISVTVPYNPSRVGHLIDGTMALYYWDGAAWQKSDTSIINPQTNIITATLPYQTIWQLQGETNRIYMPIMPYKQK